MLTQDEQNKIKAAVEDFEKSTAAELVPVISRRSSDYPGALWKGVLLFVTLYMMLRAMLFLMWYDTTFNPLIELGIFTGCGIAGAGFTFLFPFYKRWITGKSRMEEEVEDQALKAFLEHEVFNTPRRSGIVIYISLFEHIVEVVGDSGINKKVDPSEWQNIVNEIIPYVKKRNLTDGIIHGIEASKALLIKHGLAEDNPDITSELPDSPRMQ